MFIASEADIKNGKVTDVYFDRTLEIIAKENIDKTVKAEVSVKNLPKNYSWGIMCGLEEVAEILSGKKVNVRSIPEGSIFRENDPIIEIEGKYSDFAVFETAILGILSQESGVATKSARIRKIVEDKTLLSFGARRMHPAIAPAIERAAYIGGCDGISTVAAGKMIGVTPSGTIPHALILLASDTLKAAKYFDETVDADIPRVVLIDTFSDEKFEALRVAEELGKKLNAVRLDTPSSRRGNMRKILQELRWELDLKGFQYVKLFVSGGLDEDSLKDIVDVADGFGVGTSISSATTVDFSLDIVEINGTPIAKKGKRSGSKSLLRCNRCFNSSVVPFTASTDKECVCGGKMTDILEYVMRDGKLLYDAPSVKDIRNRCIREIKYVN